MPLKDFDGLLLPFTADFHVHLRDGEMMELVVPTIREGGVNTVFVMPNLVPPITTVQHALDYKKKLQQLEPKVEYLMSLYLHPDITPATIVEAKKAGIAGVKSYPAGVTTNSSSGVVDYEQFYPVFAEMEKQDVVLNLHGECPKDHGISILNAEERFLPTLLDIHKKFPSLRIVLEHCTTTAAVNAVLSCGPTVVGTITAHHLFLTIDDVAGNTFAFCKPVAKTDGDRSSLLQAIMSGNPKFFLGTDSAPHPRVAKAIQSAGKSAAAGVFTQPYATQTVLDALEFGVENGILKDSEITEEKLEGFLSKFGREFYKVPDKTEEKILLIRQDNLLPRGILSKGDLEVVPFQPEKTFWSILIPA